MPVNPHVDDAIARHAYNAYIGSEGFHDAAAAHTVSVMQNRPAEGGLPRIIGLWSAPRCRSTAFARMMAERGDYIMLHEPFSHVMNFSESQVGEQRVRSERELIPALWRMAAKQPLFFKDTTDFHYPLLLTRQSFLAGATHTFLIRHPAQAIASHYAMNPGLQRDEIGFAWLAEIYDAVAEATGRLPVLVDSDDLVAHPHETVRAYCAAVGIPFIAKALSWEPRMEESWRRTGKWHETASQTSGFVRTGTYHWPEIKENALLMSYLDYHLPFYEKLRNAAIKI